MSATPDQLARENTELREALGAMKLLSEQRDTRGLYDELAGYALEWERGVPVVPSRYASGGAG
tara:strand:+ start:1856 stop:2044 length:189 start_codon:yes stop_codon:yes gene_type:complete